MKKSTSPKKGIDVRYARRRGAIVGLRVAGHSGFAAAGQDIVCAAVSALVLSAAHGLREHCAVSSELADTPTQFRINISNGGNPRAQAVLETTISGLEAIAAAYPGHLKVRQAKLGVERKQRV